MAQSVVLLTQDQLATKSLAGRLRSHFHAVHVTGSHDEMREKIAKSRPEAVVLDIELSRLTDVASLHHDFPALTIVCTHRIPDEELWMAALDAGASDVCPADDVNNVLTSLLRSMALSRGAAA